MNLGVLLVRAPGAETPTPILGCGYSFGSFVQALQSITSAPDLGEKEGLFGIFNAV